MTVKRLKRQLKRLYVSWCRETDGYDCGLHMMRTINPRIGRIELKIAKLAGELRQQGETVPKFPGEEGY